jgi:hypothetical protein
VDKTRSRRRTRTQIKNPKTDLEWDMQALIKLRTRLDETQASPTSECSAEQVQARLVLQRDWSRQRQHLEHTYTKADLIAWSMNDMRARSEAERDLEVSTATASPKLFLPKDLGQAFSLLITAERVYRSIERALVFGEMSKDLELQSMWVRTCLESWCPLPDSDPIAARLMFMETVQAISAAGFTSFRALEHPKVQHRLPVNFQLYGYLDDVSPETEHNLFATWPANEKVGKLKAKWHYVCLALKEIFKGISCTEAAVKQQWKMRKR